LIVATGTPHDVAKVKGSYTGQFLQPILERSHTAVAS
jgi:excinuclease ABC subunit A